LSGDDPREDLSVMAKRFEEIVKIVEYWQKK
jgi:hypothetical protein